MGRRAIVAESGYLGLGAAVDLCLANNCLLVLSHVSYQDRIGCLVACFAPVSDWI